jgi:hypothetical protein
MQTLRKYMTDRYGAGFSITAAFSWSYLIIALLNRNEYGFFALRSLRWLALLFPAMLVVVVYLYRKTRAAAVNQPGSNTDRLMLTASLAAALAIFLLFPFPNPVLVTEQHLVLISTGERQAASAGSVVEVRAARGYDGAELPLDQFQLSGDWEMVKQSLASEGRSPDASADYRGPLGGGVVLQLRYNQDAGILLVILNGVETSYDLYAEQGITIPIQIGASGWQQAGLLQKAGLALNAALTLAALTTLGIALGVATHLRRRSISLLVALLYVGLFAVFLFTKQMYPQFNAERAFRDTYSYVAHAELPFWNREFWAGQRTFTMPLLYKLLGINLDNYTTRDNLSAVAQVQYWFSVLSWTVLAAAFARSMRQVWVGALAFGLVLFFSLSLGISFWDSLMLSESLSFSFFALVLALWIMPAWLPEKFITGAGGYFFLLLSALVTVFYTFTRDTNLYFVLASAGILAALAVIRWLPAKMRRHFLLYAVFAVGLFFFQNWTLQAGNRWQIHIYDHLARRILPDPEARAYFAAAGLPVDDSLMAITGMFGYEYHDLLDYDPSMAAARAWINQSGRATFFRYLLTHPAASFWKPIQETGALVNGSNLEYRYPKHPLQPVPDFIARLTARLYPHAPLILWLLPVFILLAVFLYRSAGDQAHSAWWMAFSILLTLYPMMFITWNGNPLEIERHAAQIGIQYRLAGWMSLLMLLDWLYAPGSSIRRLSFRRKKEQPG